MIVNLLKEFDPEPDGLLRKISEHINDDMLQCIATADYGEDAEAHMSALRQVRDTGRFPRNMCWVPAEVLELIRWSEPEDPEWKPGRTGEFGHWMRVFCCAALLRATQAPWNYGDGLATDSSVVQMTLSLNELPVDFSVEAMRFLAWLLLQVDPEGNDEQICAYAVCLLWLAFHRLPSLSDQTLISLSKWLSGRADEIYESSSRGGNHGLREMVTGSIKQASWEKLALKFLDLDVKLESNALKVWTRAIGEQLLE
jgi:hypothetical protein